MQQRESVRRIYMRSSLGVPIGPLVATIRFHLVLYSQPPTHHRHPQTRTIQLLTLPRSSHQHFAPTIPVHALLNASRRGTNEMPELPLCSQRQMYRLSTHDVFIYHLPYLNRQHGEEHALRLQMRTRVELLIRLARQRYCRFPSFRSSMIRLRGLSREQGAMRTRLLLLGFPRVRLRDVVRDPAYAGE